MFAIVKSIFKFGWQGFLRNKMLSFQVIFIMAVVVLVISLLFLFRGMANYVITEIQKKVDVVVAFKREVSEEDILKVKEELYHFSSQIEDIDYISKEKALEAFIQQHGNDSLYQKALSELQDNPLRASLNIKSSNLSRYADVTNFLQEQRFSNLVHKISYNDPLHKKAIERLIAITSGARKVGLALAAILGIFVVLITYNTVKLSIFSLKNELMTMRLVGANNAFIRGPFVFQVILCGFFAVLIANALVFLAISYLNEQATAWLLQFNSLNYFQDNLLLLLGIQLGVVAFLGFFSTVLASRKYLKV